MLFKVLILSLFGAAAASFDANLPPSLRARVLSVQAAIGAAFLAFILFTSNPFVRLDSPPFGRRDLNRLLQDPGLAFHPPFLYLGYVGLSMAFSFAVAALIEGRADAAWARYRGPRRLRSGCRIPASRWDRGGPITSRAGAGSSSGTRWKTQASCPGFWRRRF